MFELWLSLTLPWPARLLSMPHHAICTFRCRVLAVVETGRITGRIDQAVLRTTLFGNRREKWSGRSVPCVTNVFRVEARQCRTGLHCILQIYHQEHPILQVCSTSKQPRQPPKQYLYRYVEQKLDEIPDEYLQSHQTRVQRSVLRNNFGGSQNACKRRIAWQPSSTNTNTTYSARLVYHGSTRDVTSLKKSLP